MAPVEPSPEHGLNGAVAAELRAAKTRRRMTNGSIADQTGIPEVSIQRYLAGKRPIDMALLNELCRALAVSPARIIEDALRELSEASSSLGAVASTETTIEPGDLEE